MNPLSAAAGNASGAYQTVSTVPEPVVRPDADVAAAGKVAAPAPAVKLETSVQEVTQPTRNAAEVTAQQIQHFVSSMQRQLNVSKDDVTGYISVQIVNPDTGEVIRTLPTDELLRIARSFEQLGSTMVHQKA
jgi:flagellar protein FlaG